MRRLTLTAALGLFVCCVVFLFSPFMSSSRAQSENRSGKPKAAFAVGKTGAKRMEIDKDSLRQLTRETGDSAVVSVNQATGAASFVRFAGTSIRGKSDLSNLRDAAVSDGHFTVAAAPPTAATVTVAGRVLNNTGRGIGGATVTLTDASGERRTTRTTSFGYYRFEAVAAGATITLAAKAKRFRFAAAAITRTINQSIIDADFLVID